MGNPTGVKGLRLSFSNQQAKNKVPNIESELHNELSLKIWIRYIQDNLFAMILWKFEILQKMYGIIGVSFRLVMNWFIKLKAIKMEI